MTTYSGKDFEGASFVRASLQGAALRSFDVSGVKMRADGSIELSPGG